MNADPNDAPAAFAEYAADRIWVATHLGQFLGVAILGVALVALASAMEPGKPSAWARIGVLGTAASIAMEKSKRIDFTWARIISDLRRVPDPSFRWGRLNGFGI